MRSLFIKINEGKTFVNRILYRCMCGLIYVRITLWPNDSYIIRRHSSIQKNKVIFGPFMFCDDREKKRDMIEYVLYVYQSNTRPPVVYGLSMMKKHFYFEWRRNVGKKKKISGYRIHMLWLMSFQYFLNF